MSQMSSFLPRNSSWNIWIKLPCCMLGFPSHLIPLLLCMEQRLQALRWMLHLPAATARSHPLYRLQITLFFHLPSRAKEKPVSSNACWIFTKSSERTTQPTYWTTCTSQITASGSRGSGKFIHTHKSVLSFIHHHLEGITFRALGSATQLLQNISNLDERSSRMIYLSRDSSRVQIVQSVIFLSLSSRSTTTES